MDVTSNTVLTAFINQLEVEDFFFPHNISREKLSGNFGLVDFHVHWPDGLVDFHVHSSDGLVDFHVRWPDGLVDFHVCWSDGLMDFHVRWPDGLVDFHVHWPDGLEENVPLVQAHTSLLTSAGPHITPYICRPTHHSLHLRL